MRDLLVDIINHRFVFTFLVLAVVITCLIVFQDGFQLLDLGVISLVVVVWLALWRILLTTRTPGINSIQEFSHTLKNRGVPTLVEFYSPYCAGCMAIKPMVDQLEADAGTKLQVIRLNIDVEPGKSLMTPYGVIFTPTFLMFDASGNRVRESMFVFDRLKILTDIGLSKQ